MRFGGAESRTSILGRDYSAKWLDTFRGMVYATMGSRVAIRGPRMQ